MMESLKTAKQKLIERWVAAFNEIEKFELTATQTKSVKYTEASSYDLSGFKNGKIKPGSKFFNAPPDNNNIGYHKYGFNEHGFLTTSETYIRGEQNNIGFFAKTDNLIEFIEFNNERNVPSGIQRIVLKDNKKVLFESVFANGKGGFRTTGTDNLVDQVTKAFNDHFSAICAIEIFDYDGDKINIAHGLSILPGLAESTYQDKYHYQGDNLTAIQRQYDNGQIQAVYVAPSRKSLTTISDELAAMFCGHLVAVLKKQVFDSPLFSVELSYRYCGSYFPNPVVITERQRNEAISQKNENLFIEGQFIYATERVSEDLDKLYTEFYQLMETKNNWDAGRKMLVTAAKLMMTSKLKNEIPVTEDFITFPIDWEFEGNEFDKILLKCGITKVDIKEMKKHDWVR